MKLSGVLVLFSRFGWRSRRQRFVGVWVRMNLDDGGEVFFRFEGEKSIASLSKGF